MRTAFRVVVIILILLATPKSASATILTATISVHETRSPTRYSLLTVSDGTNLFSIDLFRAVVGDLPYDKQFFAFGLYDTSGLSPQPTRLVLNGVAIPGPDLSDYYVTYARGRQTPTDVGIWVVQISTGACVFCARAPYTAFSSSGSEEQWGYYVRVYRDYFRQGTSYVDLNPPVGVPEPAARELAIIGLIGLLAAGIRRRVN